MIPARCKTVASFEVLLYNGPQGSLGHFDLSVYISSYSPLAFPRVKHLLQSDQKTSHLERCCAKSEFPARLEQGSWTGPDQNTLTRFIMSRQKSDSHGVPKPDWTLVSTSPGDLTGRE
jgi:hypothetical protein